jgi:glycine cleavage system H protein
MPILVRGCPFPPDRHYDVEQHLWYVALPGDLIRLGMTSVATALAGEVLAFTPKRVGRRFDAGRSCATIESGKWVGPARAAFSGTVVEVNDALIRRPSLVNRDPYGEGWMLVARPDDPAAALAGLVTGSALAPAYEAWMTRESFAGCPTP